MIAYIRGQDRWFASKVFIWVCVKVLVQKLFMWWLWCANKCLNWADQDLWYYDEMDNVVVAVTKFIVYLLMCSRRHVRNCLFVQCQNSVCDGCLFDGDCKIFFHQKKKKSLLSKHVCKYVCILQWHNLMCWLKSKQYKNGCLSCLSVVFSIQVWRMVVLSVWLCGL